VSQEASVSRHGICRHLGCGRAAPNAGSSPCQLLDRAPACGVLWQQPPDDQDRLQEMLVPQGAAPSLGVAHPSCRSTICPRHSLLTHPPRLVPTSITGLRSLRTISLSAGSAQTFPGTDGDTGTPSPSCSGVAGPTVPCGGISFCSQPPGWPIPAFSERRGLHLQVHCRRENRHAGRGGEETRGRTTSPPLSQRPLSGVTLPLEGVEKNSWGASSGNIKRPTEVRSKAEWA